MTEKIKFVEVASLFIVIIITILIISIPSPQYSGNLNIVAFGDSLTQGLGMLSGRNFVDFLSEDIQAPIINSGVYGDTTVDALVRLQKDVLDKKPDIVIVLFGGNDLIKNYPLETTRLNLRTIIQEIKKSHAKIILVGLNQQQMPSFEFMIQHLAIQENVDGYVPNALMGILFNREFTFADQLHPNEKGHELIAKRILPTLKNILLRINK